MKALAILFAMLAVVGCCNCKHDSYFKEVEEFDAFLKANELDYSQLKECMMLSKSITLNGCKIYVSSNGTTSVILPRIYIEGEDSK